MKTKKGYSKHLKFNDTWDIGSCTIMYVSWGIFVDIYLFYDVHVDVKILPLLTRSQCRVSDTQVTVSTNGCPVFIFFTRVI